MTNDHVLLQALSHVRMWLVDLANLWMRLEMLLLLLERSGEGAAEDAAGLSSLERAPNKNANFLQKILDS